MSREERIPHGQAEAADLGEILRRRGFRRTPARLKILAALKGAGRPLSHPELCRRLGRDAPDRVSVYRALEAFVEAGLVHRAFVEERTGVFELSDRCGPVHCHPHFSCRVCGEIACLENLRVPLVRGLPEGYTIERQRVSLEGTCRRCGRPDRRAERKDKP